MQQRDGTKWVKVPDRIAPMRDKHTPLLEPAATDNETKNTGWPKRTEKCDSPS
jgi:branched-chain amino acid transport system substrate-binding protein